MMKNKKRYISLLAGIGFLIIPLLFLYFKAAPPRSEPRMAVKDLSAYNNYINLAAGFINSNQPEKSLEPLEKAKALNPDSAVVYNNLGVAYILLGRIDEGIAACRRAVELDPAFQLAKNNLNWGLSEKEKLRGK